MGNQVAHPTTPAGRLRRVNDAQPVKESGIEFAFPTQKVYVKGDAAAGGQP